MAVKEINNSLQEYISVCNVFFGTYMDAIWGFDLLKQDAEKKPLSPNGNPIFMSYIPKNYDPNSPKTLSNEEMNDINVNIARADQIIVRNKIGGVNTNIIAQAILATVYHYWEDKYRKLISQEFELSPEIKVNCDAIGDIRNLRISIVHNKGIAKREVENAKIFRWFKEGEHINLDFEKMLTIKNYFNNELVSAIIKENQLN